MSGSSLQTRATDWCIGLVQGRRCPPHCGAGRPARWRALIVIGAAVVIGGTTAPPTVADEVALEHVEEADDHCDLPTVFALPGTTSIYTPRYYPGATSLYESLQVNVYAGGFDGIFDAANEPSIAVDPTNRNNMTIVWRQFNCSSGNYREAGYAYTTDGGRTWTHQGVLADDPPEFRSDPVVQPDAAGNIYCYSLRGPMIWECDLFKSTDGGMSWTNLSEDAKGGDKAWMAIDRTNGIGSGNIYTAWNVAFTCCEQDHIARSIDGGDNWTSQRDTDALAKWGTLDVDPNGTVYLFGTTTSNAYVLLPKSLDAKDPNETPTWEEGEVRPHFRGGPFNSYQ